MNIAIIGAGYTGLSAAYDLGRAGHAVTLYEAAPEAGGLATGFKAPHWEWPLERFYHHLFTNDDAIIDFCTELGIGDKLTVYSPSTDLIHNDQPYPFDGLRALRFPGLSLPEKVRAGGTIAYLKLQKKWEPFEAVTAHEWMARAMGSAYDKQFGPLLRGKFGEENFREVPMTWMWSRLFKRTPKLIYPDGGFGTITAAMVRGATEQGATLHLDTPVQALRPHAAGGWGVESSRGRAHFDSVLTTVSPDLLTRLVPELPASYLASLRELKHMGAVVMTVALAQPLTEGSYWLNLDKRSFPMLSLVEHTNMVPPRHYGSDRLVYMGDYLAPDHPYLSYSAEQLFEVYEPALRRFNPAYERGWVRDMWLFSTRYAQPIPTLHHAKRIPPLETPLPGLFWASMSQVYPWDRGTNYAVELGRRVATLLLSRTALVVS